MPAKQAPPGYRCPGCRTLHDRFPCYPGCGAAQHDNNDEEVGQDGRQ